jgi:hypothetical protein
LIDENGGFGGEFWNSFTKAFSESMYKGVPVEAKKVTKEKSRFIALLVILDEANLKISK